MKNLFKLLFTVLFLSSCNKKIISCKGTPVADCICTQQYDPVCGCDGVTYSNACEAKCAGVKIFTPGKCQ